MVVSRLFSILIDVYTMCFFTDFEIVSRLKILLIFADGKKDVNLDGMVAERTDAGCVFILFL